MLAIVTVFQEWRQYLVGTKEQVIVYTDHQNLQYFLTTKQLNRRQARWAELLSEFDFRIIYREGKKGGKPDALSRRTEYRPEGGGKDSEMQMFRPGQMILSMATGDAEQYLRVKRTHEHGTIPQRGSEMAAGYDLSANENMIIPAGDRRMIGTGMAIGIPEGTYGRIAP